jgi:heme/copper-type cytochrome/quinol oxidase subunit 4
MPELKIMSTLILLFFELSFGKEGGSDQSAKTPEHIIFAIFVVAIIMSSFVWLIESLSENSQYFAIREFV